MHFRADPPAGPAGPPAVSVVLCTWNPRGDVLARVLAALAEQTLPADAWELIIIDNASNPPVSACLPATSGIRCRTVVTPLGAEDADLALSCLDRGHATGRFTTLHLTHVIPARRLDFDYQLRLAHDLGASYGRLLALRGDLKPGRRLRILARTIVAWLGVKHHGPARALDLAYYRGFLAGAARGAGGPVPPGQ